MRNGRSFSRWNWGVPGPFSYSTALQSTGRWNDDKSRRIRHSVAVIYLLLLSPEKENILGNLGTLAQPEQVIHNSNSIRKHYIQYVTNVLYLKNSTNVLFQYISLFLRGITRVTVFKTMVSYIVMYFYCLFLYFPFKKPTHEVDINLTWFLQRLASMGTGRGHVFSLPALNVWKLTYQIYWQMLPKLVSKHSFFSFKTNSSEVKRNYERIYVLASWWRRRMN
jgi:hypothetical protein